MTDPDRPASYPRRLLMATVGLVPQVVTETVWALATSDHDPFLPHEIHLVTTTEGRHRLTLGLLDPSDGRWRPFCAELGRPELEPALTLERIHVIRDAEDQELADISQVAHNEAAADLMTRLMAELTSDPDAALHVSIAGGRKTMGFLLGYALSLFGRPQDRLSHVLVDPPFEAHPEFWYPPRRPRVLLDRGQRPIRTDEADVRLALIPFVRLRQGLPEAMLDGRSTYSETVASLDQSLAAPTLAIDLLAARLHCQGCHIELPELLLAVYAWLAERRRDPALPEGGAVAWRGADPARLLELYATLVGPASGAYETVSKSLADGLTDAWLDEKASRINRALRLALGPAAAPYRIKTTGRRPFTRKGLDLPPAAITLTGFPPT